MEDFSSKEEKFEQWRYNSKSPMKNARVIAKVIGLFVIISCLELCRIAG
ncbi:hypothetical protein [Anaerovibrio sp.]